MKLKSIFQNLALLAFSMAFFGIMLEILFNFLPINDGFRFVEVNDEQPVYHAKINQSVTASKDWDMYNAHELSINNMGFRNDQDYTVEGPHPLIAIVGDSYVEAAQVDYDETFYAVLDKNMGERARTYTFGFSGAPLSQYLPWAQYATKAFKADHLAFIIISNDFDESIGKYRKRPGFMHYEECEERPFCLKRAPYKFGKLRPLAERFALVRYLGYNLQALHVADRIKHKLVFWKKTKPKTLYIANARAEVTPKIMTESKAVVDMFFEDLPKYTNLPPQKITFVIDGRYYDPDIETFNQSYFGQMRDYFMEKARSGNYNVIDMLPVFTTHYAEHQERFNPPRDGHWNALGHELTSKALYDHYNTVIK